MADVTVRRAAPEDAAELTRLRVVLFDSLEMGRPPPAWWEATRQAFAERLAGDAGFAAFVVDDPARPGRLAAGAVGWLEKHLPSTRTLSPLNGRIVSVATDPLARGRGYGRAVVAALLDFFTERRVPRVDLVATDMAEELYRSLGFTDTWGTALTWRMPAAETPGPNAAGGAAQARCE